MDDTNDEMPRNGDSVTSFIFARLDVILRMLLASIEQYKELVDVPSADEERVIGLLRAETKLLEALQEALTSLSEGGSNDEVSESLVVLADYVVLPIILILERQTTESASSTDVERRRMLIRRSSQRTCVEAAAQTLSTFVKCIYGELEHGVRAELTGREKSNVNVERATLPPTLLVRCLVACSMALPIDSSGGHVGRAGAQEALDKGEASTMALLRCVQSLVSAKIPSDVEDALAIEVANALHGTLMARIVHCCVSFLTSNVDRPVNAPGSRDAALCIQSISTLRTLMDNVPIEDKWREVLPGCFAGLYRFTLSQMRLSPSSPKGAADGLTALSRVLCLTLNYPKKPGAKTDVTGILQEIRVMARDSTAASSKKASSKKETDGTNLQSIGKEPPRSTVDSFLEEANSRLPAPLTVLMGILPVAHSSSIRLAAAGFCRVLLLDIGSWTQSSKELELKAMECCLILARDEDARVASSSRSALHDYRMSIGQAWPDHMNTIVVPRMIDIMEELSALLRSRRETELRARLQLVGGYLSLSMDEILQESFQSEDHTSRRLLAISLAAEGVSSVMRKTFTDLYDMDFDSLQYAPTITSAAAIEGAIVVPSRARIHFRFRFMSDETRTSADRVIQTYGRVLGPKHAASFIDACIADLLDSRVNLDHNEQNHVVWLHQWVGSIVVANEVLVGAFGQPRRDSSSHERKERKRKRLLISLASSILPVVTSSPLWDLPTVIQVPMAPGVNNEGLDSRLLRIDLRNSKIAFRRNDSCRQLDTSASALKGNASMVSAFIQLLETLTGFLQKDIESFLSVLLYPLFERASTSNHSQVQRAAVQALGSVAVSCGMGSIPDIVENYCDYLYGAMLRQVHQSGNLAGKQLIYPVALPGVVEVVLRNSASRKSPGGSDSDSKFATNTNLKRTNLSYVVEVVGGLIAIFDRSIVTLPGKSSHQAMITYDLARMCDAAMCFLSRSYGMKSKNRDTAEFITYPVSTEPWRSALESFRRGGRDLEADGDEDLAAPEEAFAKYHTEKSKAGAGDDIVESSTTVSFDEMEFVNLVLARACFFLSTPSLKVQVASCDTLLHGFQFLGSLANLEESPPENDTGTAILRSLSDSWPAIRARLNVAAAAVLRTEGSKTSLSHTPTNKSPSILNDSALHDPFLPRLLDLVATLCELSGDFMVRRFKDDVWPLVAQLIGRYVGTATMRHTLRLRNTEESVEKHMLIPSKDEAHIRARTTEMNALLRQLLIFLSRVYGSACATGLSEFIPLAGTMVLPLLSVENEVRELALETLKCLLLVDCDCMLRPLLNISGRGLPRRALHPQHDDASPAAPTSETMLQTKGAQDLLEFMNDLPEQLLA